MNLREAVDRDNVETEGACEDVRSLSDPSKRCGQYLIDAASLEGEGQLLRTRDALVR